MKDVQTKQCWTYSVNAFIFLPLFHRYTFTGWANSVDQDQHSTDQDLDCLLLDSLGYF
jgi:hypothetical protein